MKSKVGLFGAIVNVIVVAGMVFFSEAARGATFGVVASMMAVLALSAFLVYYGIVSAYVVKRADIKNPFFFDSLVGMLAELIIVTGATVCYSIGSTFVHARGKDFSAIAPAFAGDILMNLLWVFALFMVHLLIIGNIAGLAGWYLLEKTGARRLF